MPLTIRDEADFTRWVIAAARRTGWMVAHFRPAQTSSGRWITAVQGDGKGYPDLTLAHPHRGVAFVELKMPAGRTTLDQVRWLTTLTTGGASAAIWRPTDLEAIRVWLAAPDDTTTLPGRLRP